MYNNWLTITAVALFSTRSFIIRNPMAAHWTPLQIRYYILSKTRELNSITGWNLKLNKNFFFREDASIDSLVQQSTMVVCLTLRKKKTKAPNDDFNRRRNKNTKANQIFYILSGRGYYGFVDTRNSLSAMTHETYFWLDYCKVTSELST